MKNKINDLLIDYSEVFLDNIFDYNNDILKEIPFIKTIHSIISFSNTIEEKLFIKKLIIFLNSINHISSQIRYEMIIKIDNNKIYKQKVGEQIFEILSKIDSEIKPEFIGNLFAAFLENKIDYSKFLQLSFVVDKSFNQDLKLISNSDSDGNFTKEECRNIISYNLLQDGHFIDMTDYDFSKPYYGSLSEIGIELVKYGIRK